MGRRSTRKAPKSRAKASFGLLDPRPGTWSLDWSLVDDDGPFRWPDAKSRDFYRLAGYLASLNRLSLDTVFRLERVNGRSAIHALDDTGLSEPARQRWSTLYSRAGLDEAEGPPLEIVTMTYCFKQIDARRVVVAFDAEQRVMYPLWWDVNHAVSGSNGRAPAALPCDHHACHHEPEPVTPTTLSVTSLGPRS